MKQCTWEYDDNHGYYDTECGRSFCFDDPDGFDSGFDYCPYCGKLIKEADE